MKFEFDGKEYVIEFRRQFREYTRIDPESGLDVVIRSTYPYTTATLLELDANAPFGKKLFRTATVGCWQGDKSQGQPGDKFSLEKGRCRALRLITITLPKAMKPVMWHAYHNRREQPKPDFKQALVDSLPDATGTSE